MICPRNNHKQIYLRIIFRIKSLFDFLNSTTIVYIALNQRSIRGDQPIIPPVIENFGKSPPPCPAKPDAPPPPSHRAKIGANF